MKKKGANLSKGGAIAVEQVSYGHTGTRPKHVQRRESDRNPVQVQKVEIPNSELAG